MKTDIDHIHDINFLMLEKLDEICRKHHITYYMDSGTLLGAVRHKSFIPWDDDVDIAFRRSEYEKLCKVPKSEWGEDFELIKPGDLAPNSFFDFFPRLVYLKEKVYLDVYDIVQKKINPKYNNRMLIDLVIVDNAYASKFLQKFLCLRLYYTYLIAMSKRDKIDIKKYSSEQRIAIYITQFIGRFYDLEHIYLMYDKISRSVKKNTGVVYRSNGTIPFLSRIYKSEWYDKSIELPINDKKFMAPAGYDMILKTIYNDYMELPPEVERKSMHIKTE